MRHDITGSIAQRARLEFDRGETAWCANGSLMSFSSGMTWRLRVPGGVTGAVKRSVAGEGASLTYVKSGADGEHLLLAANSPGHIDTWDLADGPIIATRGSFLAAWGSDVDISVTVARRAGAALFGGAGLFLQRISGAGTVLIHGAGDFERRTLDRGESIAVSTGNLAAFTADIDYSIQGTGGCLKVLFSREGLFMTRLSGPGTVYLQTLKRGVATRSG